MRKERAGAETPWMAMNQLLTPDERFAVDSPHWKGFLLAPKHPSQLAALLYLLHQAGIGICVQDSLPTEEHEIIVSARAFSEITWYEQGIVEVGAGCSLLQLHQFLFERQQEVALEEDPLASSKHSVAGLILSGRTGGVCYRSEGLPENIFGVELITLEGSQIKWGGRQSTPGSTLHKLIWGLQSLPGIIVKVILKTTPIPPMRLRLAWSFRQQEALWEQMKNLKQFSSSWEYLDVVLSGKANDQGFLFAQISGLPEEMEAFTRACPRYAQAQQQGERVYLKQFLGQQKLKCHLVKRDHSLESGEYLWIQEGSQRSWWLTHQEQGNIDSIIPLWKQRLLDSFERGLK